VLKVYSQCLRTFTTCCGAAQTTAVSLTLYVDEEASLQQLHWPAGHLQLAARLIQLCPALCRYAPPGNSGSASSFLANVKPFEAPKLISSASLLGGW
jgi:hypothetical protein